MVATQIANPNNGDIVVAGIPGGEATTYIHEQLKAGDRVKLSGPYGRFFIRKSAPEHLLLLAGGTGLSSIKSMLLDVLEDAGYSVRTAGSHAEALRLDDRLAPAWNHLGHVLRATGRQAAAHDAFLRLPAAGEAYRAALERGLGLAPSATTERLARDLRADGRLRRNGVGVYRAFIGPHPHQYLQFQQEIISVFDLAGDVTGDDRVAI